MKPKLTINELFSGIGAQIQGLKNIDLFDTEVICTSDIDKDAMFSYATIHSSYNNHLRNERLQEDNIPFDKIADYLLFKNIGYDFKEEQPYDWHRLTKTTKGQSELMKYYLTCTMSKNKGDISKIEKLPYADLWTYSFPCQDISVAGKQAGIQEGTRSGLLFEVERLLTTSVENNEPPKYLLLENVKNLVGKKHKPDFDRWIKKLDELGYNTYWQVLNAKNCDIPQNRERVFAVSIRKDIDTKEYTFPSVMPLSKRLKDMLDDNVEDKYYLKSIKDFFIKNSLNCEQNGNGFRFKPHNPTKADIAFAITTRAGGRMDDNYVNQKDISKEPYFEFNENNMKQIQKELKPTRLGYIPYPNSDKPHQSNTFYDSNGTSCTINPQYTTDDFRIRKLTPKECWRLMGFKDEQFNLVESIGVCNSQLYKQAGNSIVVNCIELLMEHLYKAQYDKEYKCKDENFTQPHKM